MLTLAVLGDSIAFGQGADREADTPGARLATALTDAGYPARARILAVPRARSEALAAQARTAVDENVELAVIIIGANDLTHFVPPQVAAGQLADALATLRAGGIEVVVAPAPDMSAVPWVPAQLRPLVQAASASLRRAQSEVARAAGARVADVEGRASAAFATDPTLFSADHFHPSSAGYTVIADALWPAVRSAAAAHRTASGGSAAP